MSLLRHGARAAAIACALLSTASRVHAQEHRAFEIAVHAPEQAGCVSAAALTEEVEARAGRSAGATGGNARLQVDITIDPQPRGYRALVSIADASRGARGQRELTAQGACSALDDMLVLVIASSVGVWSEPQPAPAPAPEAEERIRSVLEPPHADAEPPVPAPEPSPIPSPATPWRVDVEASGRVLTGSLPAIGAAAGVGLFAAHGALGLRAAAAWLLPARSQDELQLRITGGFGELDLCGRALQVPRLAVLLCAGLQAGALYAEAGPLRERTPRWDGLVLLAPSVSARVDLLSWAGLALGLGSTIPLVFPRYSYLSASGDAERLHAVELGVYAELALWIRLHP